MVFSGKGQRKATANLELLLMDSLWSLRYELGPLYFLFALGFFFYMETLLQNLGSAAAPFDHNSIGTTTPPRRQSSTAFIISHLETYGYN
jgi:hypothetical protein